MGNNENFLTGAMQGFAFVRDQQRQDDKDARQTVLQKREDEKYQKGLDLDKIQAVRYAIATTPEGEDPTKNLTEEQRKLVLSDPEIAAMVQSPEERARRKQNLALVDQGFEEYTAALAAPDPRLTRAAEASFGPGSAPPKAGPHPKMLGLQKMIQGAQGEWGPQLQKGQDQFGQDINEVAKAHAGKVAPDGTPVGTKVIHMLHPSDDGKSLAFELKVTTVDPKTGEVIQYTAPATKGRGGAADEEVIFHPISELANDLALRKRMLAYADARAVELGSDEPIKRLNEQEIAKAKTASERATKEYEHTLKKAQIKFEQGIISKNKLEEIQAKATKDLELAREKQKGDEKLAHIKGGYDLEGRKISAGGKGGGGRDKEMTKGQAAEVAAKLLKRKEAAEGELDEESQAVLDVALTVLTGEAPKKKLTKEQIDNVLKGDGRQMPIPPKGKQPYGTQAIAAPAPAKAPASTPAPAKKQATAAQVQQAVNNAHNKQDAIGQLKGLGFTHDETGRPL